MPEPFAAPFPPPSSTLRRSPGTPFRVLLFFIALSGSWLLLMTGFPPGAADRLPVLSIALLLALLAAGRPNAGLTVFAFLFPCAGLLVRLFGGTDPSTWPALLFGGLAAGWTFRFIYDFESAPEPSPLDPWLKALLAVWLCSTALAVARASTLWAALKGLTGRAVNSDGLLDAEAIRETIFSLSALAAGAAFYFLLRRSGSEVRGRVLRAAIWGVTVSSAAAWLQRLRLLPQETRPFWKLTGRHAGGAVDPNSLGMLCGLVIALALVRGVRRGSRGGPDFVVVTILAGGLLLSGSRSGFLLVILSLAVLAIARGLPARVRVAGLALLATILVAGAVLVVEASPGTIGSRIAESFDPKLPLDYRVSERPALWRAAARLARAHPIEGEGVGSFSWRFPDLMLEENRRFAMRDNPGSAYLQALGETGITGLLLTLAFALALGAQAVARIRALESDPIAGGAAVSLVAFLLASLFGSHWSAPDASLLFFLLASRVVFQKRFPETRWVHTLRGAAVALYAAATLLGVLATTRPEETFRYSPRIGFHELERAPDGLFRWTKKDFALWVNPSASERVWLAHSAPLPRSTQLTIRTDGRIVFVRSLSPGDSLALRLNGAAREPRAFCFSLSDAFVPRRLRVSSDRRELGLQARIEEGPGTLPRASAP